ncbi:MAG: branched-chain amino acid ABC transporter permease [Halobacteriaceae archaeon]
MSYLLQSAILSPTIDPTIFAQLFVLGVLLGGIYGFAALGLSIIFGVMEVINVAHGAFMVIGMYTVWTVSHIFGFSPFFGVPLAAVVLFILGIALQRTLVARVMEESEGDKFLVTVAFLIILIGVIEMQFSSTPRELQMELGSVAIGGVYFLEGQLYALSIAIITFISVWTFLHYTDIGRAIRGTADNRSSAIYAGINVRRIDYVTFGLGAGLAGLAGALITFIQPFDPYLGNQYLTTAFVVVVIGGLGSIPGTLIGGLIIGMIHVFGLFYLPGSYYHVLIMLIFITVLLVKPTGILGSEQHE